MYCGFLHNNLLSIPCWMLYAIAITTEQLDTICTQIFECIQRGSSLCLPKVQKFQHLISGSLVLKKNLQLQGLVWLRLYLFWSTFSNQEKHEGAVQVRGSQTEKATGAHQMWKTGFSQSRHNYFWKVVCNVTKSTLGARSNAPCVDQCSCNADIANVFSAKLQHLLYADIPSNSSISDIADSLSSDYCQRGPVPSKQVSQMVLNSYPITALTQPLSKLFATMLWHGSNSYVSQGLCSTAHH